MSRLGQQHLTISGSGVSQSDVAYAALPAGTEKIWVAIASVQLDVSPNDPNVASVTYDQGGNNQACTFPTGARADAKRIASESVSKRWRELANEQQERIHALHQEIERTTIRFEARLTGQQKIIVELQSQMTVLRAELKDARRKIAALEGENERLRLELAHERKQRRELEERVNNGHDNKES